MTDHCFISYSVADGLDFATKLFNELEGGHPHIDAWFDKNRLRPGDDWDEQIASAISNCKFLVFAMSADSTAEGSTCKQEWVWALKYKKPVVPLLIDKKGQLPFRLGSRQYIDFTTDFDAGLAKLRKHIAYMDSAEGALDELKHRLADANRDLRRASEEKKALIQSDIDELKKQIEAQQKIVNNPEEAKRETEQKIQNGLERERKPEKPLAVFQSSKFINQPPGVMQNHFRDRFTETEQAILFLKNEAQRVLTVVGRGGAGKTAMVCRLLKFVENGGLPDDFERKHGRVDVDGIVYLSEAGSRKVNFANLFEDLCKLLPAASAEKLSALYREPQTSTESKTVQLLAAFQGLKQVIVLLDNFENVVDAEKGQVTDAELDEALRAFLHAPHHPVKIIITTRVSARELDTFEPARQRLLPLDTGLQPEYAREAFVLMDEGNLVGIKNAGADLLNLAVTRTLGLPRALEALYAALRTDRFTTLQELLDLPILPEQVVQAYVGEAFNRLDTNAQKVMQALAVYNRPVTPAAVDYLLAPHIPAIDSAPILQRLANMHFARKESGRFYLHPVDREFAFGLIPLEVPKGSNESEVSEVVASKDNDTSSELSNLLSNSDSSEGNQEDFEKKLSELFEKVEQQEKEREERALSAFTQTTLLKRAANYYKQARKPRAEWKKLDDLSAQLAEFDLRCAAGDYDTAASVIIEFDREYLSLWGHYRLMIKLHERIINSIKDKYLLMHILNGLETAYRNTGNASKAIPYLEHGLNVAQEAKNREAEGTFLGNMGNAYADLGDERKAIEFYEQALFIAREVGSRREEAISLGGISKCYEVFGQINKAIEYRKNALEITQEIGARNSEGIHLSILGSYYSDLDNQDQAKECFERSLTIAQETGYRYGEGFRLLNLAGVEVELKNYKKAIELALQSSKIGNDISRPHLQNQSFMNLALAYLLSESFALAQQTIEAALQYDVPENNHNASALHGIITLRQGDASAARGAFVRAIGQADEILSKTAEYYSALDAKGLAICGLALCARDDGQSSSVLCQQAIEIFKQARKIAPHAGVIKSVLRLFDELVKCDQEGILKGVREVVEGK